MQQRILRELEQPDCLEAALELEALEIFSLMKKLSESTDETATQESKSRRSRSRDSETQAREQEQKKSNHREEGLNLASVIDIPDSPVITKPAPVKTNISTQDSRSTI
jgi:hypothetical protein